MKIRAVKFANFRNLIDQQITLQDKNFFIGANAQGKTNVLEALYCLMFGESFRLGGESWLVKQGSSSARVEAEVTTMTQIPQQIAVAWQKNNEGWEKKLTLDGKKISKSTWLGMFPFVLFSPDDVSLLRLYPINRRGLINNLLIKVDPVYKIDLFNYHRALKQRNYILHLIKQGVGDDGQLEAWENKLAKYGCALIKKRKDILEELSKRTEYWLRLMTGDDGRTINLNYVTQLVGDINEENYLQQLVDCKRSDLRYGYTTFGPHRDDVVFMLDGFDARHAASQGEFRLMILAIKLAEGEHQQTVTGETPIYLLDDIFSELDSNKIQHIIGMLQEAQVVITSVDETLSDKINRVDNAQIFHVEKGVIRAAVATQ